MAAGKEGDADDDDDDDGGGGWESAMATAGGLLGADDSKLMAVCSVPKECKVDRLSVGWVKLQVEGERKAGGGTMGGKNNTST